MRFLRLIITLFILVPGFSLAQPDDVEWTEINVKLADDGYIECPGCNGGIDLIGGPDSGTLLTEVQGGCHVKNYGAPPDDYTNMTFAECYAAGLRWGAAQMNLDSNVGSCTADWKGTSGYQNAYWSAYECSTPLQNELNAVVASGTNGADILDLSGVDIDFFVECYLGDAACTRTDEQTQTEIPIDPFTPEQNNMTNTNPNTSQPTHTNNVNQVINNISNEWTAGGPGGGAANTGATTDGNVGGGVSYGGGGSSSGSSGDTYNTTNNTTHNTTTNNYDFECQGELSDTLLCAETNGESVFEDEVGAQVIGEGIYNDLTSTELFQLLDGAANALDTSNAECAPLQIDLSETIIGQSISTTLHCELAVMVAPVLQPIMLFIFAILGINIIYRV